MDLEDVADELYRVPPEEFIPLRNSCRQLSQPSIAYGRQRAAMSK